MRMGQFGQELRRAREDRGISVNAVCAVTKVSARHVEALEADRLMELPGGVFRKGIVRSYLSAVGLEELPWMERFESVLREAGAHEPEEADWAAFAENVRRSRPRNQHATGLRWLGVMLMLVVLLVCGWLTWRYVLRQRLGPVAAAAKQSGRASFDTPSSTPGAGSAPWGAPAVDSLTPATAAAEYERARG